MAGGGSLQAASVAQSASTPLPLHVSSGALGIALTVQHNQAVNAVQKHRPIPGLLQKN